jgi:hypothetical protein
LAIYLDGSKPRTRIAVEFELDAAGLEPFEPLLKRIATTAFTSGIRAAESAGIKVQEIPESEKARRRFTRGVHYGYNSAQFIIGSLVADFEDRLRSRERERKTSAAQPTGVELQQECALRNRQLVLRRVVDSILFTMVDHHTWILRRFIADETIHRIDPKVLRSTLQYASRLNSADRYKFSLVSDLTTLVQVGDLVEVSVTSGGGQWRIIELKQGKMNAILSGIIFGKPEEQVEIEYAAITRTLGEHAAKQARRMLSQRRRMDQVKQIVTTNRGLDPQYHREIIITPTVVAMEDFSKALSSIVEAATRNEVAAVSIDKCLDLIGCTDRHLQAHGIGAIQHAFFHIEHRDLKCSLGASASAGREAALLGALQDLVDLVQLSMVSRWGRPVFLWGLTRADAIALVMGHVRIFARLRMDELFRLGAEVGLKMTWIEGVDAEKIKGISDAMYGNMKARGVRVEYPNGKQKLLLSGFFTRVYADLTRPRQLVEMIKRDPESH